MFSGNEYNRQYVTNYSAINQHNREINQDVKYYHGFVAFPTTAEMRMVRRVNVYVPRLHSIVPSVTVPSTFLVENGVGTVEYMPTPGTPVVISGSAENREFSIVRIRPTYADKFVGIDRIQPTKERYAHSQPYLAPMIAQGGDVKGTVYPITRPEDKSSLEGKHFLTLLPGSVDLSTLTGVRYLSDTRYKVDLGNKQNKQGTGPFNNIIDQRLTDFNAAEAHKKHYDFEGFKDVENGKYPMVNPFYPRLTLTYAKPKKFEDPDLAIAIAVKEERNKRLIDTLKEVSNWKTYRKEIYQNPAKHLDQVWQDPDITARVGTET